MHERQSVWIFVGLQGGFVHQTTDGEMCHQQAEELLGDEGIALLNKAASRLGMPQAKP